MGSPNTQSVGLITGSREGQVSINSLTNDDLVLLIREIIAECKPQLKNIVGLRPLREIFPVSGMNYERSGAGKMHRPETLQIQWPKRVSWRTICLMAWSRESYSGSDRLGGEGKRNWMLLSRVGDLILYREVSAYWSSWDKKITQISVEVVTDDALVAFITEECRFASSQRRDIYQFFCNLENRFQKTYNERKQRLESIGATSHWLRSAIARLTPFG